MPRSRVQGTRFIPACAGAPNRIPVPASVKRVHPRVARRGIGPSGAPAAGQCLGQHGPGVLVHDGFPRRARHRFRLRSEAPPAPSPRSPLRRRRSRCASHRASPQGRSRASSEHRRASCARLRCRASVRRRGSAPRGCAVARTRSPTGFDAPVGLEPRPRRRARPRLAPTRAARSRCPCVPMSARRSGSTPGPMRRLPDDGAERSSRRRGAGDRAGLAFRIDAAALARRHGHAHRPDRMPADVVLPVKLSP